MPHHVTGRTPSGCLLLQTTLCGVVLVERKPVQFRTITGIHRLAPGELARRPRSRVSQPLNTADRPTSHNGTIMQRGPLLQPLRSTENILSGPPRARRLAGLSTGRLAHSHCLSFGGLILFSLVPVPPKRQTHPPDGFSSRRFLRKSLTPFPWGSPASPRFPLGEYASPLFPKAVTVSCLLLRRGRNRASPVFQPISCCGGSHSTRAGLPCPCQFCARGFAFFKKRKNAGSAGTPHGLRSNQQPIPCRRYLLTADCGNCRCASSPFRLPCGAWFSKHRKNFCALRLCEAESSEYWKIRAPCMKIPTIGKFFFQPLENGAPAARAPRWGPPIKWGPVRYAP